MVDALTKMRNMERKLFQKFGRAPRPEELAKELGVSVDDVRAMKQYDRVPVSTNRTVGNSDDAEFGDFIPDGSTPSPSTSAGQEQLRARIQKVLKSLTHREREIIKLRFGLGDGYAYTLEEVGRIFKVTRERVRQIEAKAKKKLQHPSRSDQLEGFLGPEE
jgi:RNA polymerase primary sigma factor